MTKAVVTLGEHRIKSLAQNYRLNYMFEQPELHV